MARAPLWAPPLLAVQFLTRLPVPALARLDAAAAADGFARAMAWLPLVGALIGGVTAAVFVAAQAVWPPMIAALLALAALALATAASGCFGRGAPASGRRRATAFKLSTVAWYVRIASRSPAAPPLPFRARRRSVPFHAAR